MAYMMGNDAKRRDTVSDLDKWDMVYMMGNDAKRRDTVSDLDKWDQNTIDDLVRRVGTVKILEVIADHVLFQAAKARRKRDSVASGEAKARYRLASRKLEKMSYDIAKIARDLKPFVDNNNNIYNI